MKLTVGMATHDDADGTIFTVQGLREMHPEIEDRLEIVVVDNNPTGRQAERLRKFHRNSGPTFRYETYTERVGTAGPRDYVVEVANGDVVVVVDCHVLIELGALKKLLDFFEAVPRCQDLFHGPMKYDDRINVATHMDPVWRDHMYGIWASDFRGEKPDADPFEIPAHGMGLYCCWRKSWLGFHRKFRGFGGEEGYIHEKYRQAGRHVWCLPFLRWWHRFDRPAWATYHNSWDDRFRNYLVGWSSLGLDLEPVRQAFLDVVKPDIAEVMVQQAARGEY